MFLWLLAFVPLALGHVTELTKDDFDARLAEVEHTLVMFYAPWCGHCKQLKPHFEKAGKDLSESTSNVRLARLDCTEHGEKCTSFGVTGYPTVKYFRNGVFVKEYDGSRDADGIRAFMHRHSQPPSKMVSTVEELEALVASEDAAGKPLVVAYIKGEESDAMKKFREIAMDMISDVIFAHTHDRSVLGNTGNNYIRLYRPRDFLNKFEDNTVEHTDRITYDGLTSWIQDSQFGLVGYRTPQNEKYFPKTRLVVFYHNASQARYLKGVNYYRNRLIKLIKESHKPDWNFKFAYSYSGDYYHELYDLGHQDGPFPLVTIFDSGKKYLLSSYSPDNFLKFLSDFQAGSLEPYMKSEPIPEPSNDAAVTVVGKTFEQMINDPTKDVFVMFHAPWCGHCKKLMPKFKEAAEKLRNEPSVRFALYDATANDVPEPYSVRGYPTLYFAPKSGKKAPKLFEGTREVDDLVRYVAQHSTDGLRGFDKDGQPIKEEL